MPPSVSHLQPIFDFFRTGTKMVRQKPLIDKTPSNDIVLTFNKITINIRITF